MMKSSHLLLSCLLALGIPALRAVEPAQPGPVIDSVLGAVEWTPLINSIASKGALHSTFTEQRWFGFKKTPVELRGELRFSPERGLCLNYLGEDPRMVILDSQGVLLRDGKGRQKAAPNDSKVSDLVRSILSIMQLDLAQLRESFELHGVREGVDWRLDFEPRTKEHARNFGSITIFGRDQEVRHLVFRRGTQSRVEIFITQTQAVSEFSAAERTKYFR